MVQRVRPVRLIGQSPVLPLQNQQVLVLGLGASGLAASSLLRKRGASVVAVDSADSELLRKTAAGLRAQGVEVRLGASALPPGDFNLGVVSPGVARTNPILRALVERSVPVIGELELG